MVTVELNDLHRFCQKVLVTRGLSAEQAALVTEVMVEQDLRGHGHHGSGLLALRVKDLDSGIAKVNVDVEVLSDLPAFTALDAHGLLGPLGAVRAIDVCIKKAQTQGIASATLRDMPHWVIPAYYSMRAAAAGLIGYCVCYTNPSFAPVGGTSRVLGNNPMSYAIPADPRPPIVVDFGVSASTNRMREMAVDGELIPDDWAIDTDGNPISDPSVAIERGVFLPFGEHRGYGLGLVHEILGATLNAMPIGLEGVNGRFGAMFVASRVDVFRPAEEFLQDVNRALDLVVGSPSVDSKQPIRYPGERSGMKMLENLERGRVDFGKAAWNKLYEVSELTNVALPIVCE